MEPARPARALGALAGGPLTLTVMGPRILLEVAVASPADAEAAAAAGADRLELSAALELGGLTPTPGALAGARRDGLPVVTLVSPRPGGFCYAAPEVAVMLRDLEWIDGEVAVGFLTAAGEIDVPRLRRFPAARVVFHRAFDLVPDPLVALERLIDLGVPRVMADARNHDRLARLVDAARGRIAVLPAGGVRPANVRRLVERTGCTQVHGSFKRPAGNRGGPFGGALRDERGRRPPGPAHPRRDGRRSAGATARPVTGRRRHCGRAVLCQPSSLIEGSTGSNATRFASDRCARSSASGAGVRDRRAHASSDRRLASSSASGREAAAAAICRNAWTPARAAGSSFAKSPPARASASRSAAGDASLPGRPAARSSRANRERRSYALTPSPPVRPPGRAARSGRAGRPRPGACSATRGRTGPPSWRP
jgi:copper homeostasis protein